MTLISIGEVTIPKNYLYLLINRSLSIDKITNKKEQMPRTPYKDSKKIVLFFRLFFTTIFTNFLVDAKGRFLSESEIDISNCQIHMPNHYLKFEILKLSSITVECCISVSVLNLIHQESNHPIMFIFFGYWLHLFCLLCSVLITKTALLDCMPPENVSCVLITRVGKFKWQSLR